MGLNATSRYFSKINNKEQERYFYEIRIFLLPFVFEGKSSLFINGEERETYLNPYHFVAFFRNIEGGCDFPLTA